MNAKIQVILARHGQAGHNLGNVFGGGKEDTELTEKGIRDTKLVAQKISKEKIEYIFCSDLKRSLKSARIIQKTTKTKSGHVPKIHVLKELREIDFGDFTGKNKLTVEKRYPSAAKAYYSNDPASWNFPAGENFKSVSTRVANCLSKISKIAQPNEKVLIVGHAAFNLTLLRTLYPQKKELWSSGVFPHDRLVKFDIDKTKPSVLLIGWYFLPKLGGVESIIFNLAKFLTKERHKVAVLTSQTKGQPDRQVLEKFVIYRRSFIDSQKKAGDAELTRGFCEILDEFQPDIIHFHNGSYPAASTNMIAGATNIRRIFKLARARDIKIIEHAHNAQLKNPEQTKILRELPWDALIAVSNFVKKRWLALGTNAKKLKVIYNGVDVKKFKNAKPSQAITKLRQPEEVIILFPARVVSMSQPTISKQKNFALLIKALGILKNKGVHNFRLLAILNKPIESKNTGSAYSELDRLIEESAVQNKIEFIDEVLPDKMPEIVAAADIVCVPSTNETFGLIYIEAMAAGKVTIASDTGGPTEYIKSGENGFLVDPNNPNELAEILKRIITNAKLRKKIRPKAQLTASKFDYKKFIKEIIKLYGEI